MNWNDNLTAPECTKMSIGLHILLNISRDDTPVPKVRENRRSERGGAINRKGRERLTSTPTENPGFALLRMKWMQCIVHVQPQQKAGLQNNNDSEGANALCVQCSLCTAVSAVHCAMWDCWTWRCATDMWECVCKKLWNCNVWHCLTIRCFNVFLAQATGQRATITFVGLFVQVAFYGLDITTVNIHFCLKSNKLNK